MYILFKKRLLLVFVVALAACSTLLPKQHLIDKQTLVGALQKKFPLQHEEAGGLLSLVIDSPKLTLLPEQNRVSVSGRYLVNATLKEIKGDFVFSSKLRYDAQKRALFLSEAHFDSFASGANPLENKLRSLLDRKISDFVSKNPLYAFRPDELVVLGTKMEIGAIDIVAEGILLQLQAAR